jgi:hypothetical protein
MKEFGKNSKNRRFLGGSFIKFVFEGFREWGYIYVRTGPPLSLIEYSHSKFKAKYGKLLNWEVIQICRRRRRRRRSITSQ